MIFDKHFFSKNTGRIALLFFSVSMYSSLAYGQQALKLPRVFGDHMVLQRDIPVPVWGWAAPGSSVRVTWKGNAYEAYAGTSGAWQLRLDPCPAGGPFELTVAAGNEKLELKDILVGDVWFATGQSNMDRPLALDHNHFGDSSVLKEANSLSQMRLFIVERDAAQEPLNDLRSGEWMVCTTESASKFSAVGYFFASELYRTFKMPLGVIESTWGGTPVQSWMSEARAASFDYFQSYLKEIHTINDDMMKVIQENERNLRKRRDLIQKSFVGLDKNVHKPDFNDKKWKSVNIPDPGINTENYVWIRRDFELTQAQSTSKAVLHSGRVMSRSDAWINGKEVFRGHYSWSNESAIPDGILKKGKNQVTMRIANAQLPTTMQDPAHPPMVVAADSSWRVDLSGTWKYDETLEPQVPLPTYYHNYPSLLYNAMIAPMVPYGLKGVIWYQGESNTDHAYLYRDLFPAMIEDWRIQWGQGYFPFLYVQLANFQRREEAPSESDWAELREAQLFTLDQPNTGMAVIIDIGEARDIHPQNKWDVGRRLALWAKKLAYGQTLETSGPLYESASIANGKATLSFTHTGSGLKAEGGKLAGFAIAGEDKVFYWAQAEIKGDQVIVWSENVPNPVAVRYAWANNPEATLYNKEGLPASPFRTDTWKGITDDRTY